MPGVFPDYPAPVIRNSETGTEMVTMCWGMPPPHGRAAGDQHPQHIVAPHWRMWLKPVNRLKNQ